MKCWKEEIVPISFTLSFAIQVAENVGGSMGRPKGGSSF